jgi:phenylalanyl-tRNA synthetase alpha chain
MAEAIQQVILDTLDAQSSIKDTRSLTLPGQSQPATSHDAQTIVLGALNSLLSREVRLSYARGGLEI